MNKKIVKVNAMKKEIQKPKLHISQNDFIDITMTDVTTPVVCNEIESQMKNPEHYEIVVDKK